MLGSEFELLIEGKGRDFKKEHERIAIKQNVTQFFYMYLFFFLIICKSKFCFF